MSTDILSLKLGINSSYLIRGSNGIILIDAGTPNKIRSFRRKLARLYIHPEDIKLIVLTHSHFDHSGSAKEIQTLTGAKVVMHESEKVYFDEDRFAMPKGVNTWGKMSLPLLFPFFKKIRFNKPVVDVVIKNPEFSLSDFGFEGKIYHTPGHTPGSISLLLNSGEAFVGCQAHNGLPFRIRPGFPIYAQDIEKVKESWKLLIGKGAKMIFPGHGKSFPVEVIKKKLLA
jgi:hydroxyacylglutathione hydrolase